MPVTAVDDGTTAALTLDTPETLVTSTTVGVYVLTIDVSAMQSGDEMTVTATLKTLSGSTAEPESSITFTGEQSHPVFQSKPILVEHEIAFVIEQTSGTGRAFPWSVARVAS